MSPPRTEPKRRIAFVLSQLGFHVANRFAERLAPLGLAPPHVGILELVRRHPGQSQQALAAELGIPPSRLVGMLDDLERRGLVQRERLPHDRRVSAVHMTEAGGRLVDDLHVILDEHERDVTAALTPEERDTLLALLRRIADEQGLSPNIHPALRKLR